MLPSPPVVRLSELLAGLEVAPLQRGADPLVQGLAYDSRRVQPGDLFICLRGARDDGHRHAREAASRGAVAVLVERPVESLDGLPQVAVPDGRRVMGRLAARYYGEPRPTSLSAGPASPTATGRRSRRCSGRRTRG